MIKVLKIEQIKGYKNSFYVYFDNETKLKCFTKNILDYDLETGRTLTDESFTELKAAVSESNTRERAARLLSRRQMSERELELNLLRKGEPEENVRKAVEWLKEIRILNDVAYAGAIVRHYAKKGYGLAKIKSELYRRHIPKELWDEAMEHMPEGTEAIDRYVRSKLRGNLPDKRELKRVTDALYRRGFSWEEIREAIRRYDESLDEELT